MPGNISLLRSLASNWMTDTVDIQGPPVMLRSVTQGDIPQTPPAAVPQRCRIVPRVLDRMVQHFGEQQRIDADVALIVPISTNIGIGSTVTIRGTQYTVTQTAVDGTGSAAIYVRLRATRPLRTRKEVPPP